MSKSSFPQRKSPRLHGYNYSASGAYFVTICTHQRQHPFGHITDGAMLRTQAGEIAAERWYALPEHHSGIELDAFIVMPNQVHGIMVVLGDAVGADNAGVVPTLGTVIGSYKSGVTRRIREALGVDNLLDRCVQRRSRHARPYSPARLIGLNGVIL
ncbi:MAG: hypothetical protein L6Q98_19990 [Anaerolineae bacterium]|nr:hypothetical protein [Anaerolineae bacterium]NUQ05855.1 hypothetical protein [Anaerolineae bacterium]